MSNGKTWGVFVNDDADTYVHFRIARYQYMWHYLQMWTQIMWYNIVYLSLYIVVRDLKLSILERQQHTLKYNDAKERWKWLCIMWQQQKCNVNILKGAH